VKRLILALPLAAAACGGDSAYEPAPGVAHPRLVVLGVDGMDPDILREVLARFPERTPNLAWIAERSGIHELGTSQPPQSPVAWSNFITGRDPGGHGIYDFLHRDPLTRAVVPSTTLVEPTSFFGLFGGDTVSNRSGVAFWEVLAQNGVPADIWRMPINYPVEPSAGWSFSGMMTPAVDSAYGEASFFTTDASAKTRLGYSKLATVVERRGAVEAELLGPPRADGEPATVPFTIHVDRDAGSVAIEIGTSVLVMRPGEWSEFVPVEFTVDETIPLLPTKLAGVVRFHLRGLDPLALYASPVNIDPAAPIAPVSEPQDAAAEVADSIGTFYTQGMPEDVNALKSQILTDQEYLQQSELVHVEGERMMDFALDRFLGKPEGGLLFFYYSTIDLNSHMLWRHVDPEHPFHDAALAEDDISWWSGREGTRFKDVVHELYVKMDPVIGEIRARMDASGEPWDLVVLSDHGFAPFARKFSLNTWLLENGYLVLAEGQEREPDAPRVPLADQVQIFMPGVVDWSKTRAYGIGFNGLYLNLAGREGLGAHGEEGEPGSVSASDRRALLVELKERLEAEIDPQNGRRVVLRADIADDVYASKERLDEAPDILVGYDFGYGNSDEASLGRVPFGVLTDNDAPGTFNGSHLMAPDVVGGILLSTRPVRDGAHGLEDLTVEILAHYGIEPVPGMIGQRVFTQ
jgi:predicted AlkP superfamily phosphohydrolase/phosphomutase